MREYVEEVRIDVGAVLVIEKINADRRAQAQEPLNFMKEIDVVPSAAWTRRSMT
jgi:hypothetical protein